jgi:hypothetical protein
VKTPLAILFSLLLIWAQVAFNGPVSSLARQAVTCKCCACGGTNCCLSDSAPTDSSPLSAPPARTAFASEILVAAPALLAWTLPLETARTFSFSDGGLLQSAGVPLFTRHCALLI